MFLARLFQSSIGQKILMGATGVLLFLFVFFHMVGNLQVFVGAETLNNYGRLLRTSPELLWVIRIGLLATVALHIYSAIVLALHNRASRPVDYADKKSLKATLASRTMMVSGGIVLAFIVFHIFHFTTHSVFPEYADYKTFVKGEEVHDIYRMVVAGFQKPAVSIFYVLSVGLLCFHLSHGAQSMFRSLGLNTPAYAPLQSVFAKAASAVIFAGMAAVPAAVLLGWIR